jgi:hypothetical protein
MSFLAFIKTQILHRVQELFHVACLDLVAPRIVAADSKPPAIDTEQHLVGIPSRGRAMPEGLELLYHPFDFRKLNTAGLPAISRIRSLILPRFAMHAAPKSDLNS